MTSEERLQLYIDFAKDSTISLTPLNINWPISAGICSYCDYGSQHSHPATYNPLKEHSPNCLLVKVVKDLADHNKEEDD